MTATARPSVATTTRVAAREVREVAFRALLARGASGGEAAAAADAVLWAERVDASGVAALLAELDRPPAGRIPVHRQPVRDLEVLRDPAGRGPLLVGPLACDLVAATDRPVLLPGWPITAALEAFARATALSTGVPVALRTRARTSIVTEDGRVFRTEVLVPHHSPLPEPGDGLVICPLRRAVAIPAGASEITLPDATPSATGLWVDANSWTAAYTASRQFLVPERCGTTSCAP